MSETPLRRYLDEAGLKAEDFAASNSLSPWSVRHWARGNKLPMLDKQRELESATGGKVTPADWLEWSMSRDAADAQVAA